MTPVHIHLMLNHFPVIGLILGLFLFGFAVFRKSQEMIRVCLALFVVLGLVTIPVYLTGEPSEDAVEHLPGVSEDFVEEHEEAAEFALIAIEVLAVASLAGLLFFRSAPVPRWFSLLVLILALFAAAVMERTGNLGGQIRHSEVRSGAAADAYQDDDSRSRKGKHSDND